MPNKKQIEKFREAAKELECNESEKDFDRKLGRLMNAQGQKVCPECGHEFQGNGWDGIDGHWRGKNGHEDVMSYEEAWPLLKSGNYR